MAWRQSPSGSEQYLTRAAAAARTRTQRPGKHLAVHASELVVKPELQILRRYRRPLLLCLEHTHRPALENHVHCATRLGSSRSLNLRFGIRPSIQFRVLVVLALRERQWQSVNTRLQSCEACIRLRLQISEHLPITDFDFAKNFAKNFIDSREHALDKLNHLGDLTPQLLYVPA